MWSFRPIWNVFPYEPLSLFKGAPTRAAICLVEGAEFGECTDEGEGGNGAQAGDISEEEELVLPCWS